MCDKLIRLARYSEEIHEKKLIEIYDIQIDKCLALNMRSKIRKNFELIQMTKDQHESSSEKILDSLDFRLKMHTIIHLQRIFDEESSLHHNIFVP
mgnify:CR=1 FL=1